MDIRDLTNSEPEVGDIVEMELGDVLVETVIDEVLEDGVVIRVSEDMMRHMVDYQRQLKESTIRAKKEIAERFNPVKITESDTGGKPTVDSILRAFPREIKSLINKKGLPYGSSRVIFNELLRTDALSYDDLYDDKSVIIARVVRDWLKDHDVSELDSKMMESEKSLTDLQVDLWELFKYVTGYRPRPGVVDWTEEQWADPEFLKAQIEKLSGSEPINEISNKLAGDYYSAVTKQHIDKVGMRPNMYDRVERDLGAKRKQGLDRAFDRITRDPGQKDVAEGSDDIHSARVGDEIILRNKNYGGVIVKIDGSDISFKNESDGKRYKATLNMIDRNLSQEQRYKEKSDMENKRFDDAIAGDMKRIHKSGALKKFGIGVTEDSGEDIPDLEEVGEPIKSIMDAEFRLSSGDRIFAFHEMDEEPFEIFNVGDLSGYTYDQLLAVPADSNEDDLMSEGEEPYDYKVGQQADYVPLNGGYPPFRVQITGIDDEYIEFRSVNGQPIPGTRETEWSADPGWRVLTPVQGVNESSVSADDVSGTLNSYGYYTKNARDYVHDKTGDKFQRAGSQWKHQSGVRGRGPEELDWFLSSKQEVEEGKTGPGLWANIHAKRKRIEKGSGERMRKPGSEGAPSEKDLKSAQGTNEGYSDSMTDAEWEREYQREKSEKEQARKEIEKNHKSQFKTKEEAIEYANDKLKTFKDSKIGMSVYAMPDGGFDVISTARTAAAQKLSKLMSDAGGKHLGTLGPRYTKHKMAEQEVDETSNYGDLDEAKYQGREVTLNTPMAGDVKKSKVYVKNAKGNVVKVNFGEKGARIKKSNPGRRKSFRARHGCDNPGPKWKAKYWSCRAW